MITKYVFTQESLHYLCERASWSIEGRGEKLRDGSTWNPSDCPRRKLWYSRMATVIQEMIDEGVIATEETKE